LNSIFLLAAKWLPGLAVLLCAWSGWAQPGKQVLLDRISQYHHIQVYDEEGIRTLSFNGSWETKMSLANPLTGHFEYTEYFQMPFLWNPDIKHVLMAGLGGGSTQRAYQHYFTNVTVDTVEIDPVVVEVATNYFHVTETTHSRIHTNDARVFLNRSTNHYDVILMDAYSTTPPYGSSLPPHLTTKEFFTLASAHLTTNGLSTGLSFPGGGKPEHRLHGHQKPGPDDMVRRAVDRQRARPHRGGHAAHFFGADEKFRQPPAVHRDQRHPPDRRLLPD
jgi:hypothetical protein